MMKTMKIGYFSTSQIQLVPAQLSSTSSYTERVLPQVTSFLTSRTGLILLASFLGIAALQLFSGKSQKGKLATSHFGGGKERKAAFKVAMQQMVARKRNAVCLYIGKPTKPKDPKPLYIPDVQRGVAVMGAPGSGKTFSVIDPMIRSVIDQGFPLCLYDFKYPTQSSRIAGYAKRAGYDVRVFAPGFPETGVCNPLDFLRDPTDGEMARQIATVLNRNFRLMTGGQEDAFFGPAGDQLTTAILMLTKGTRFPDVMMSQAILSSEDLAARLMAAKLHPWVEVNFGQFFGSAKSEKTASSIIATTSLMFTRFMQPGTLAAFTGKSTIPLDLKGKQLLIFGMDRERRDVVGPLLATCLHMIITRNVVKKREDPLVMALDELPTLFLPNLVQWLNENREDGLCCILGFQNVGQMEKAYGKELTRAILGGTATKFVFNPNEIESARMFSDYLGDEEIHYKQKSRSRNHGKGGGGSSSISDQERTRKLFEASQFLKLPPGTAVVINPAYTDKQESSIPFKQKIKILQADLAAMAASDTAWEKVHKSLVKRSKARTPTKEDLEERFAEVDTLFPIPEEPNEEGLLDREKYSALL